MANTDIEYREEQPGLLSKGLKILAIPFAAAAGYWFGQTSVRNAAYDNAKWHGAFKSTTEAERDTDNNIIGEKKYYDKLRDFGAEADAALQRGERFDLPGKVKQMHLDRTAEITKKLELLELGTLKKQWNFIGKHHRQNALMNAFTAAGITVGALFAIANTKAVSHVFTRREAEKQPAAFVAREAEKQPEAFVERETQKQPEAFVEREAQREQNVSAPSV